MSGSWTNTTLGEICDAGHGEVKTGPFGSQLHKSDYIEEGIPVVMPTNLEEGRVSTNGIARISDENVARLSKHKLAPGDIVYGRRGDIGRQALITEKENGWLCGTGCLRISIGQGEVDSTFLHYYLRDEKVISYISNQAVGATMPNLNTKILRGIPVQHPDLPTQRRIAGILSAYDDLIENNLRRIKILEDMAQSLYREWFVHFRYPGHESVPLTDSPLGPIPKGWEVGTLQEILVLQRGFDLPKAKREDGDVPIYAASGVTGFHSEKKVKAPGVVTGRSGTIGHVMFVQDDFWPLNTTLWVKDFPKSEILFAYYFLKNIDLSGFNSGAAVPTLNRNDVHGLPALIPARALQKKFQNIAESLHSQVRVLENKNQTLRQTRDLLLPKLLTPANA